MTKAWIKHENTIHDLYKVQGKTLEDTMKIMKAQHGFDASTRAYRAKFKKWGWTKYNKQKRPEDPAQMKPLSVASSYEAPLMTPGPSSEGTSSLRRPVITRGINSPNPGYSRRSPDVVYSSFRPDDYQGIHRSSSPTPSTPAYLTHQIDPQKYAQTVGQSLQSPQSLASPPPQRNAEYLRWRIYDQQAQQQQRINFRPILPAIQQNGQYQNLHIDASDTPFSTLSALLTPNSPFSTSIPSHQRADLIVSNIYQLREYGRLNERLFSVGGQQLTTVELFVQSSAQGSAEEIRDFCKVCAIFVQQDADITRIVPHDFAQTIHMALRSSEAVAMINRAVLNHRQQLQHQRQDGGLEFPLWVSVWISACQQGLWRKSTALSEHLDVLSYYFGEHIDVHRALKDVITDFSSSEPYRTPESLTNQQPHHNIWDQQ